MNHNEKLVKEGQDFIDLFKKKMKDAADECLGEIYVNLMPYLESDAWSNFRSNARIELSYEYKESRWKDDWAKDLRRAIFVENRNELSELLNKDLLERIKVLEDRHNEYECFRYSEKTEHVKITKSKMLEILQKGETFDDVFAEMGFRE